MVKTLINFAADCPLSGPALTLANLRKWSSMIKQQEGCNVTFDLACDKNQRSIVAGFNAFLPASQFAQVKASRLDWGACEIYRFKWKRADRPKAD